MRDVPVGIGPRSDGRRDRGALADSVDEGDEDPTVSVVDAVELVYAGVDGPAALARPSRLDMSLPRRDGRSMVDVADEDTEPDGG